MRLPLLARGPACALVLTLSGCATILGGGSSQAVSIQSSTPATHFVIRSSSGIQIASGDAPQSVRLPRKNEYQIDFTAPGFQPQTIALTKGTNGWIFGNLVVGWIVGFAIDFATGSAYKLEPSVVNITMVQKVSADGSRSTDALVSLYDQAGRLIRELTVPLVPVEESSAITSPTLP
ncbi:MAG: hypothetical protein ABIQ41_05450 [Gemmatimonadales bacterium]